MYAGSTSASDLAVARLCSHAGDILLEVMACVSVCVCARVHFLFISTSTKPFAGFCLKCVAPFLLNICVFSVRCAMLFTCAASCYVVCSRLFHHRAAFLLLSLSLSSAGGGGKKKTFFQNGCDKFSVCSSNPTSAYINRLSRERLRRGLEEEEKPCLPGRKTIKAESTQLPKCVTPHRNTEVPLWEKKKQQKNTVVTQNTAFQTNLVYIYLFSCCFGSTLIF